MELVVQIVVVLVLVAAAQVTARVIKGWLARGDEEFIVRDEAGRKFRVTVPRGSSRSEVDEAIRRGIERLAAGG